jgi:nicotinamide mononucleotide transporter
MELSSILEYSAIVLAILYVILAAKESIWCWYPAFVSSSIYVYITYSASLIGESLISLFYVVMAMFGWWQWTYGSKERSELQLKEWKTSHHLWLILIGFAGTALLGRAFSEGFDSAMPYLDAFTTSFSLIATYMVTRKVLSNWIYWVVIDLFNIFLYWNRRLEPTSGLYAVYTILAIVGYISWRKQWLQNRTLSPS